MLDNLPHDKLLVPRDGGALAEAHALDLLSSHGEGGDSSSSSGGSGGGGGGGGAGRVREEAGRWREEFRPLEDATLARASRLLGLDSHEGVVALHDAMVERPTIG